MEDENRKSTVVNMDIKEMRTLLIDVEHVGGGVVVGVLAPDGGEADPTKIIPTLMYSLAFAARDRGIDLEKFGDIMNVFMKTVGEGLDLQDENRVLN